MLRSPCASTQMTPPRSPAAAARPASVPEPDRVIAAQHEREASRGASAATRAASVAACREDLGEEAHVGVVDLERLRLRRRDVAAVDDVAPEAGEPLLESGVAERRRAHVDAAPALAEIERRADDRDLTLGRHAVER